jgi:hypothetical protein
MDRRWVEVTQQKTRYPSEQTQIDAVFANRAVILKSYILEYHLLRI